jgi:hypothetical protein
LVADEKDPARRLDERSGNEPLTHRGEPTGACSRSIAPYDRAVPETPPENAEDQPVARDAPASDAPDDISREAPYQMPSRTAFLLSFASVVVAGLFGGIIGYGLADVGCTGDCEGSKLLGTLIGSTLAAGGVGIVAVLVLRAMAEWKRKPR